MNTNDYSRNNKTIYTIDDEYGEKSSITIEKFIADRLQDKYPDVHALIQNIYYEVCDEYSNLSRIKKGDETRMRAFKLIEDDIDF